MEKCAFSVQKGWKNVQNALKNIWKNVQNLLIFIGILCLMIF